MILKIVDPTGQPKITVTNEHPSQNYPILLTTDYPKTNESFFYIQLSISETKALMDDLALLVYLSEKV